VLTRFVLELYFESDGDRDFAERASAALQQLVCEVAPHVALEVHVLEAYSVRRNFDPSIQRDVPSHDPSLPGRQTLLITSEDIQAEGRGWGGNCVVSKRALDRKTANGGNPADILIHEWIHTLHGKVINGRQVPFTDDAEKMGFSSTPGADGEPTWHDWYRFALGG
jgi:hypothetical protein